MWSKPWKLKEGFILGGGLLLAGLLLQLAIGPVDWGVFAAPVNGIALVLLAPPVRLRLPPALLVGHQLSPFRTHRQHAYLLILIFQVGYISKSKD